MTKRICVVIFMAWWVCKSRPPDLQSWKRRTGRVRGNDEGLKTSNAKAMNRNKRVPTDEASGFGHNPFAQLSKEGFPPGPEKISDESIPQTGSGNPSPRKNRGRVDIKRNTAGRGGKTVTVISGFVGIGLPEKEKLAKQMQKLCGTGGTVKEGRIEIQGDKRTEVARILTEAGFRPVFAGG